MVRQVLRLAVAVLAQLDDETGDEVEARPLRSHERLSDQTRVRSWRAESDEDWLFVQEPDFD